MSSTFLDMDLAWTLDEEDDKVERVGVRGTCATTPGLG